MARKTFTGTVVSAKMRKAAIVEILRKTPHPLYGKLVRKTKRYKVGTGSFEVKEGQEVVIAETRPMAKGKFFEIVEVKK